MEDTNDGNIVQHNKQNKKSLKQKTNSVNPPNPCNNQGRNELRPWNISKMGTMRRR